MIMTTKKRLKTKNYSELFFNPTLFGLNYHNFSLKIFKLAALLNNFEV